MRASDCVGIFKIRETHIRDTPDIVAQVLTELKAVPVSVIYLFHAKVFLYTAISFKFKSIEQGDRIPEYNLRIETSDIKEDNGKVLNVDVSLVGN